LTGQQRTGSQSGTFHRLLHDGNFSDFEYGLLKIEIEFKSATVNDDRLTQINIRFAGS
jgi:hypothetical protein